MKLLLVFFISLFAIASASKIEFDKLKFVIQTLGEHPKNRHLSIGLSRQKREIDSVSNITEIANPTADVSTDEITLAAEIPSAPMMTTIAELTTTSEETATTTEVPSTLSVSTGDPTFTVLAVNPSTEATTLAAETSILTDQPTVDTLKNSINEATTAGEIIPSSEPANGETLTSISTISNVYLSSGALDALEMIVTVAPKQMSILDAAAELTSVPIESTILVLETTVVAAVEPPAGTLFDDLSIEAVPVVPSAETASTLTQDAVILAEEKTTDVNMITTLTTVSAIPIESTTETSTSPSFPTTTFDKTFENQITRKKDRLELSSTVTVPSTKTPASAKTASTLTEDAAFPAKEKTTDVNIRITLTTKSAIPIETTTETSTPRSFPANAFDKTMEDQITRIKNILEHSSEKQIEKVKETWAIFKFYLMDSLVPGTKSNNIAARYARFPLSNEEEVKRNLKLFTDFTEKIQRKPGYQLEKVMNSWEKLQNILESYPK